MKLKLPPILSPILTGTVVAAIGSVLLSLTLESEVSEVRMGQYGGFIGLLSSASAVAVGSNRNNEPENQAITPKKPEAKTDFNPILGELIQKATENHLNALQPGSPEYFATLELYGKLLSGENGTPDTNTQKLKTSHRNNGD
ncbi:MAG TPA: hypothetical protein V6D21_22385 [Candidatus Obscuribacterales bacterium]